MSPCLDENQALGLASGTLSPQAASAAHAHVEQCPACATWVKALVLSPSLTSQWGRAPTKVETLAPGTQVDRYRIDGVLGEGAMGVAYDAFDPELSRHVCLKLLKATGPTLGESLRREARTMARVSSPHVVAVHDVGALAGRLYLVMERVEGESLNAWLAQPRAWRGVLNAFLEAGAGLLAAHQAGVVHGDFKPANVLVGRDGRVRVADFGLARFSEEPGAAQAAGTPAYMAPEQARGEPATPRSDQFAFAVALFEALVGVRPFDGGSSWSAWPRRVPRALRKVLARALKRSPAERYASMAELLEAMRRAAPERKVGAVVWLGAAAAVVAVGVGSWLANRAPGPCELPHLEPSQVLSAEARAGVKQALLATGSPIADETWSRVESALDSYAARWTVARGEACRASAPAVEQKVRLACLELRAQELDALVAALAQVKEGAVVSVGQAVAALRSVEGCASGAQARPLPQSPALAAEVQAVRVALARLEAALALADPRASSATLEQLEVRAAETKFAPLQAEVALVIADTRFLGPETGAGRAPAWRAVLFAEQVHDDVLASLALSRMYAEVRVGEANDETWLRELAEMAAARRPDDARVQAEFAGALSERAFHGGRWEEAITASERSIAASTAAYGADHPRTVSVLVSGANLRASRGLSRDARPLIVRAREAYERMLGPRHPLVASALTVESRIEFDVGRVPEALALARRAHDIISVHFTAGRPLALTARTLGMRLGVVDPEAAVPLLRQAVSLDAPGTVELASSKAALAEVLFTLGEDDAALKEVQAAIALAAPEDQPLNAWGLGPLTAHCSMAEVAALRKAAVASCGRARSLAVSLKLPAIMAVADHQLGKVALDEGRAAEAKTLLASALETRERLFGADNVRRWVDHERMGEAQLALGEMAGARASLERAKAMVVGLAVRPGEAERLERALAKTRQ